MSVAAPTGGPRPADASGAGLTTTVALPLRLVLGWIFVAAAWRRLVLAPSKHEIGHDAWLGHKINTFLPHATWPVQDVLEVLVREPTLLDAFAWVFTLTELVVGLLLLLGLATRLAGIGVLGLGLGLMHTSGWLGPTCLSEWHTASLMIPSGGLLAVLGAGELSLDRALFRRAPGLAGRRVLLWSMGGEPCRRSAPPRGLVLGTSLALVVYVMGMNQTFHGGVWGPLHNHSTVPGIEVGAPVLDPHGELRFSLYRDRGPETWGAHVLEVRLVTASGEVVHRHAAAALRALDSQRIVNAHVNQVRPGPHALEVPLGARAELTLPVPARLRRLRAPLRVEVEEVGGLVFRSEPAVWGAAHRSVGSARPTASSNAAASRR